jgi:hypothetical protein
MGFMYREDRFLTVIKMCPRTGFLGACMSLKACCRRGTPPVGKEDQVHKLF